MKHLLVLPLLLLASTATIPSTVLAATPSKMQVTWPNGGSLTAVLTNQDDHQDWGGPESLFIKPTAVYRYDYAVPGTVPIQIHLRVRYTNDGSCAMKFYSNGLGYEGGVAKADGSVPFTMKSTQGLNVNMFQNVTITPIP